VSLDLVLISVVLLCVITEHLSVVRNWKLWSAINTSRSRRQRSGHLSMSIRASESCDILTL